MPKSPRRLCAVLASAVTALSVLAVQSPTASSAAAPDLAPAAVKITSPVTGARAASAPAATRSRSAARTLGRGPGGPAMGAQVHALWSGMAAGDRDREFTTLAAHGVTWVRLDVSWSMIQPDGPGRYQTWGVRQVDDAVGSARAHGLKVLVMFWRTPRWARSSSNPVAYPDQVSRYAAAIGWAANHWRGRVAAWEVWNEPNLAAFAQPVDARRYTALLKAAYPAVKRADPAATVVGASTMYIDTDWIGRMYAAGAHGSFDALGVHSYQGDADTPPTAAPASRIQRMLHTQALVTMMRAKGDAKKQIWFTEFGWSTHANSRSTPVWEEGVTTEQQAAYLIASERLVRARWPQVTHMFWYNSRDRATGTLHSRHRGLMTADFRPKPALIDLGCHVAGRGCR
jgi:hypothetical protein